MTTASPPTRTTNGRFAKGSSGNPKGRPEGARNRSTRMAEALEPGDAVLAVRALARLALAGDGVACRFLIGRYEPVPRSRPVPLDLPEDAATDPRAIYQAALRGVIRGEITPDEGLRVARLVVLDRKTKRRAASPETLGLGTTWSPLSRQYPEAPENTAAPQAAPPPSAAAAPESNLYSPARNRAD
jgi:hypothetical protein